MAVLISNGAGNLNAANRFNLVAAHNLGMMHATGLALSTTRTVPVTFSDAGDLKGVVLSLYTTSMTDRAVEVLFQEDVSGTWTTRLSKTLTTEEITGTHSSGVYRYRGQYVVPFEFATTYAVDTTPSKWRFRFLHGTGTGTWTTRTSDATNPFFAAWLTTAATFTDDDSLIIKDKITINATATFGGTAVVGSTVDAVAVVLCSNIATPEPANVAQLEWQNPALASYTLTIRGIVLMPYYSGFRAGTSTNRISIANRARILFTTMTTGTGLPRFVTPNEVSANIYGGLSNLFLYGEIPTYQYTTLTSDAVIGQPVLEVNDSVDWVAGDQVVIGKQNIQDQGVTTIHTISTVVDKTITLTTNLATNDRISGGTVIKINSHGVYLQSANALHNFSVAQNLQISGVDIYNTRITTTTGTTYYMYLASINQTYHEQYLVQDVTSWTNSTTSTYVIAVLTPPKGVLIQRVYCHRVHPATGCIAYYHQLSGFKSDRCEVKDCRALGQYAGTISTATNIRLTIENCVFENARVSTYFCSWTGVNGIFKNNYFWGSGTTGASSGALRIGQCINPIEIGGNKFNNCVSAINFAATVSVNCIDQSSTFGDEVANTEDISFLVDTFPDYVFRQPVGDLTINYDNTTDMAPGGKVSFMDFGGVTGEHRTIYQFGRLRRTGAGLDDTTTRTTGTYAMRFNSVSETDLFELPINVSIGDIQNSTMNISIWVKINHANYYAGTHVNPKLTVTYDATKTEVATAIDTTDWQELKVSITPTTDTGKITVTLSGVTDATDTEAYFYWSDMSVNFPQKLSLTYWYRGEPYLPPVTSSADSMSFWNTGKSQLINPESIGKYVKNQLSMNDMFLIR
jgi:hypothetical protein